MTQRLLTVLFAAAVVVAACSLGDSGHESSTPGSLLETGASTTTSVAAGDQSRSLPGTEDTEDTEEPDHPDLTVVVDSDTESVSAPSSVATSISQPESAPATSRTSTSVTDADSGVETGATTIGNTGDESLRTGSPARFATLGPGAQLPTGDQCAAWVRADGASSEHRPDNTSANASTPAPSVTDGLAIDGADPTRNQRLASRIDGDFTGTTEQILQWGACKWGFDEDVTRARAVAESSWRMSTTGDRSDDAQLCDRIGLTAPCPQSYGLLQVKGTVHEGTYPASAQATAFGVDYAMAWLRACFEGGFGWIDGSGDGRGYTAGDEWGCVGAWFSGRWWDQSATEYVGKVRRHLEQRTWESYR